MATLPQASSPQPTDKFVPRSRFIELVTYDRKANAMDVTFKSGSVRRYLYVFPATFETFKQSPTHDAYFSRAIRGKLGSVSIRSHTIGREVKRPLKEVKKRRTLDDGIKRIPGTIARAGL